MPSVSHVDPRSMFAAFTDAQISMIATEIATGHYLGIDTIEDICDTPKQVRMLADFANDGLANPVIHFHNESDRDFAARHVARVEWNLETFLESL
jgi:hypothetical protein